jgi:hypothetical protein
MASSKTNNGLCTLTAVHWEGDLPLPGQYVKAARGRTAFMLVEIIKAKPGLRHVARFRCERRRAVDLTEADIVHAWEWSRR